MIIEIFFLTIVLLQIYIVVIELTWGQFHSKLAFIANLLIAFVPLLSIVVKIVLASEYIIREWKRLK